MTNQKKLGMIVVCEHCKSKVFLFYAFDFEQPWTLLVYEEIQLVSFLTFGGRNQRIKVWSS